MNANNQDSDKAEPRRRRRLFNTWLILFAGILALMLIREFILQPTDSSKKPLRLIITRRGEVKGKPVVYFKVDGAGRRLIEIICGERDVVESQPQRDFLSFVAPASPPFIASATNEFGVYGPTNCSVWKLSAVVSVDTWGSLQRFAVMPHNWLYMRRHGTPFIKSIGNAWSAFYAGIPQVIESELITNSLVNP